MQYVLPSTLTALLVLASTLPRSEDPAPARPGPRYGATGCGKTEKVTYGNDYSARIVPVPESMCVRIK